MSSLGFVTRRDPKIVTHKATRTAASVAAVDNIAVHTDMLIPASSPRSFVDYKVRPVLRAAAV